MKRENFYSHTLAALWLLSPFFFTPLLADISKSEMQSIAADVKARFDEMPQNGFAEITAIRNSTDYPGDLVFDKGLHDETPRDSIIAIKHKATGKYLAARQIELPAARADKSAKKQWIVRPDAADTSDKATQFIVSRCLSTIPKLRDFWGISSPIATDCSLQASSDGNVGFFDTSFQDVVADSKAHWTLQGGDLAEVALDNRPTKDNPGGVITYVEEDRAMRIGDNVDIKTETATWALANDVSVEASGVAIASTATDTTIRYGDTITIEVQDGDDFVVQFKDSISRSKRQRDIDNSNYCWEITSHTGKKNGSPVSYGDVITFTSLSKPSVTFVNTLFSSNVDKDGNNNKSGEAQYTETMDYALRSDRKNGLGSIQDEGWLQTFASDWNGMSWSNKHDGPDKGNDKKARFIKVQKTSIGGQSVLSRDASGKWVPLSDPKKFVELAVRTDTDVWGLAPDGSVWQWTGKAWNPIPGAIKFIDIATDANKHIYTIDDQGNLYSRTEANSWEPKKGQARAPKIKDENWALTAAAASTKLSDIYSSSNKTEKLPATGDYVFYFKAVAPSNICIKIAAYDIRLWTSKGGRSSISKNDILMRSAVSKIPSSTEAIDIAIVMQSSQKTLIVYVNGIRLMTLKDQAYTITPNTATLGTSPTTPVNYGALRYEVCPDGVDLDAYMSTRNDTGSIAVAAANTIWYIADNGILNKYDGSDNNLAQSDLGKSVTDVSCADDGTTWAVTSNKQLWTLNTSAANSKWEMRDPPLDKPFITDIAARNQNEVYILGADGSLFLWNGKVWTKQANTPNIRKISIGSGVTKTVTPIMKTISIKQMMTHDKDGNPYKISDASKLSVEVLKLGFGGNIASQETVSCSLPAQQNPEVSGFAKTSADLAAGAVLTLQPLASRGGAWPQKTFEQKNRGTISFIANPTPKGDIQVILGDSISTSYLFKIKIGTANNTRSCIIRRSIVDNKEVDEEVFGIDVAQNPLARAIPGSYAPYWISYENGLILVGMGLPGEHTFMAYRTDTPPDLVDHAGFSTKDGIVKYSNIQYSPPVDVEAITRIDTSLPAPLNLAPSGNKSTAVAPTAVKTELPAATINNMSLAGGSISWQNLPFRIPGGATVGFEMKGSQQAVLILGEAKDTTKTHYLVTFGDGNNEGISIKRSTGNPSQPYRLLAAQNNKGFSGLNLSPNNFIKAWVSYTKGLFVIGNGAIGENPIFASQDILGSEKIQEIGFAAFGSSACTIQNVTLAAPVNLSLEKASSSYEQTVAYDQSVSGQVDIILPFWYRLSQEGPSLKLYDKITNMSFFVAGMPQQGTLYPFIATIKDDGFMSMASAAEPNNPLQLALKREITTLQADAALEQQKASLVAQRGQLDAADIRGKATLKRSTAEALSQQAASLSGSTNALATGLGMAGEKGLGIALAIGLSGIAVSSGLLGAAAGANADAAKIELHAEEVANAAKRDSLNNQETAMKLQQQASLLAGNAQFAFKGVNSYVFTDAPRRPALGDATLQPEMISARNNVTGMMGQLNLLDVTQQFEVILGGLQEIVYRTTHCFVVTDVVKKQFVDKVQDLVSAYNSVYGANTDRRIANKLITLLMTSINNCYLISPFEDADTLDTMYAWINKQAQALLNTKPDIDLCPCFGQYIWFPIDLKDAQDNISLSFQASGKDDLFIAFAQEPTRVRNTNAGIYEIKINNTKTSISLQSLGTPITLLTKDMYTESSIINGLNPKQYTIAMNSANPAGPTISLAIDNSKKFTWTDKYPYTKMRWIGVSCWDKPVSITNIQIPAGDPAADAAADAQAATDAEAQAAAESQAAADAEAKAKKPVKKK